MKNLRWLLFLFAIGFAIGPACSQGGMETSIKFTKTIRNRASKNLIYNILSESRDSLARGLAQDPKRWGIQIMYTPVKKDGRRASQFKDHSFNVDPVQYFYPASTVKFPIAILALQRLRELAISGLDRNSTFITQKDRDLQTEVFNDPTSEDGRPTIAHYIKKILLVSDNDAYNRLYEWLGQDYINESLHKLGYQQVEILHRLSLPLSTEENRYTNPVMFFDTAGRLLYQQQGVFAKHEPRPLSIKMGKGYISRGKLVEEPFDFSFKNRLPLSDLHHMIRQIVFPSSIPAARRFLLADDDLNFLRDYMSRLPSQSHYPSYDSAEVWDNYVKFLYYGSSTEKPDSSIRIYNKVGNAYGFLIDAACFEQVKTRKKFLLSAVIYCNSDAVFNDDRYDYESIGFPFLKTLGRVLYEKSLPVRSSK
ncbi:MAG: serine hydrolase [Sphingomonadales bacterium]